MRNWSLISLAAVMLLCSAFGMLNPEYNKVRKVVIDAGHGGKDPGTNDGRVKEKDIALAISKKVGQYVEEYLPDVDVVYTRQTDRFVDLWERAAVANREGADVFISVHVNALSNPNIHGTETYAMGLHKNSDNFEVARRENSVIYMEDDLARYEGFDPEDPASYILFNLQQQKFQEQSIRLAQLMQDQFEKRVKRKSLGVKQAGFVVLYETSMPSVLVETGFITNPAERRYLQTEQGQSYLASGIFRAFRDYKKEREGQADKESSSSSRDTARKGD